MSKQLHRRLVGDTLTALSVIIATPSGPTDLTAKTVKFRVYAEADNTVTVAETTTGVSTQPTQDFTASATTDRLTCNEHKLRAGDQIILSTTGTLPAGLSTSTRYFVRDVDPNTFKLSDTGSGAAIDVTSAGTGTHSFYVVGGVQITLPTAATTTAGRYRLWVTVYSGSAKDGYPNNSQGLSLEVVPYGG